jgi:hypothetical protein
LSRTPCSTDVCSSSRPTGSPRGSPVAAPAPTGTQVCMRQLEYSGYDSCPDAWASFSARPEVATRWRQRPTRRQRLNCQPLPVDGSAERTNPLVMRFDPQRRNPGPAPPSAMAGEGNARRLGRGRRGGPASHLVDATAPRAPSATANDARSRGQGLESGMATTTAVFERMGALRDKSRVNGLHRNSGVS